MQKVSAAPRAWRKDLTGDFLRQYNWAFIGSLAESVVGSILICEIF
jgi:hypothetical protein